MISSTNNTCSSLWPISVSRKSETEDPSSSEEDPSSSEEATSSSEEEQTSSVEDGLDAEAGGGSDLNIYRVGNGSRCIVWNYDIFGFNGGRTREIADLMASKGISIDQHFPDLLIGKSDRFHDRVTQDLLC